MTRLQIAMRGRYYEGPTYSSLPAVVTFVHDPTLYGNRVNVVVTLDGSRSLQEGWSNEEVAANSSWRTDVLVLGPDDERTFPCLILVE